MASTRTAAPYDGTGIGRGWPLLTGERGHFELCAGNDPLPYLAAMAAMASPGGMIPEQVWDAIRSPLAACFPGEATRLGDAARLGARRIRQAAGVARN